MRFMYVSTMRRLPFGRHRNPLGPLSVDDVADICVSEKYEFQFPYAPATIVTAPLPATIDEIRCDKVFPVPYNLNTAPRF